VEVHNNLRTRLGKSACNAATNIAAGTCYQDGLTCEAQEVVHIGCRRHVVLHSTNRAIVLL
jgi:hypothetical protein